MKYTLVFISLALFAVSGCKKDDDTPPTVPILTTSAVTNISGSTAQSGGVITDNGGASITASGICWSKTNNIPTITDDTTKGTTSSGSFTSMLKNLQPSTTYYVRAYAINNAGAGYGNVVTFNTSNAAPQAKNITIIGAAAVTNNIKVRYTYSDFENDPESGTTFQWYITNDTVGTTVTAITGATDSIYTIVAGDQSKFLRVTITPKSSVGTSPGAATNSFWVGPVAAEPTTITFTYNGQTVTYGILTSATTGKKWLDRNLGAIQVATSATDYLAYGDLFQWGRPADGHQLMTWTSSTSGTPVNGTTSTQSTTDNPGNNLFIISNAEWRSTFSSRWSSNPQGPCPVGWHVPTRTEWINENLGPANSAFTKLKIISAGQRIITNGNLEPGLTGSFGIYWSSSVSGTSAGEIQIDAGGVFAPYSSNLASGNSIRCIKD